MPKFESVTGDEKINRRDFLKRAGNAVLAVGVTETIGKFVPSESKAGEENFNNKEYLDLEQEFIEKGFSDSQVFSEFKSLYGKEAFEKFKKEHDLSYKETQRRWSSSILRHRNTFLDRARNWKKVNEIDKNAKGYEMVNGQVESIDRKSISKKSNKDADRGDKKSTPLESTKIDTSAY